MAACSKQNCVLCDYRLNVTTANKPGWQRRSAYSPDLYTTKNKNNQCLFEKDFRLREEGVGVGGWLPVEMFLFLLRSWFKGSFSLKREEEVSSASFQAYLSLFLAFLSGRRAQMDE